MRKSKTKGKAIVLLSGGIDSSTVLAIAKSCGHELYALSFDYRQRHRRELESAKLVATSLGVRRHLVIRFDLRTIGGSALTSEMKVPKSEVRDLGLRVSKGEAIPSPVPGSQSPIPVTYVPARNTIFLAFALAWAEVLGAPDIFIGANAVDYSGYPDCRPEYLRAFEDMANLATKASVENSLRFKINAPLLSMTKKEIIERGIKLGLDYSLTWSCYDPQEAGRTGSAEVQKRGKGEKKNFKASKLPDFGTRIVPCGRCDSCRFRAKGFREAGIKDPLSLPG
jgi:7-cyano-7-deazaguanine synthase